MGEGHAMIQYMHNMVGCCGSLSNIFSWILSVSLTVQTDKDLLPGPFNILQHAINNAMKTLHLSNPCEAVFIFMTGRHDTMQ